MVYFSFSLILPSDAFFYSPLVFMDLGIPKSCFYDYVALLVNWSYCQRFLTIPRYKCLLSTNRISASIFQCSSAWAFCLQELFFFLLSTSTHKLSHPENINRRKLPNEYNNVCCWTAKSLILPGASSFGKIL
jgi:hypothetical protein